MCEYCNISNYVDSDVWKGEKHYVLESGAVSELRMVYFSDKGQDNFFLEASGEESLSMEITYCPICGRKLN